jgi:hypothetical protein
MNRFNIIWSLKFGLVHILNLPLLQTQNSKLFIINPYAPIQNILLLGPMRFIILFPILIQTITQH